MKLALHVSGTVPSHSRGSRRPLPPKLHYTLQGVKRAEAEAGTEKRERLPISPNILRTIKRVWEEAPPHADKTMLWEACCFGFFGFLRSGEMTAPSDRTFDPSCHLVDNPENPQVLRVTIKQSKTDPFCKGINLNLGKTAADLCPVREVLNYLVVRGRRQGPLFLFADGTYLTRLRLVEALRQALGKAGIDPTKYSGHSFRIGAATTAVEKRHGGFGYQNSGSMEKSGLPGLHSNAKRTASQLL